MNRAEIDLNLLLVFEAVMRERSVTRAATTLHLTQSSVSSALNRLRTFLGDPLFVRTNQGMQPTPRAQEVSGPLLRALQDIRDSLRHETTFDPTTSERVFNLLMSDIGEATYLPRLMAHLKEAGATVRVAVSQHRPQDQASLLESGVADLAIGVFPDLKFGFYQQRMFRESFACMVRRDHPQIGSTISLKQFLAASHAVVEPVGITGVVLEKAMAKRGISLNVMLHVPHFLALPAIIAGTDLIATVPRRMGTVYPLDGNVRLLPVPLTLPTVSIRQYWHRRYHNEPGRRWLRQVIAKLFIERR